MNGHICSRSDFAILEYDSRADDYNQRAVWPVTLKAEGTNYTTTINGWAQKDSTRLGRFVSIVKLNT